MVKLLIEYALNHNISLEYDKNDYDIRNNSEIKKLLENYEEHKIQKKKRKKKEYGNYPLLWAISNNNIEIVKLLIEYSLNHYISLKYDKDKIENNSEIKKLLEDYEEYKKDPK
eukprot:jgi/Orpsp1_1/1181729/evm.model.c7180000078353.1